MGDSKKQRLKEYLKEAGRSKDGNEVVVTCTKCKRTSTLRTSTPALYTKEVIAKWVCLLCK